MEPFKQIDSAKMPSLFLLSEWMGSCEGLSAGFTSRLGGTSEAPWSSLNMGLHVGDENDAVIRNRELLSQSLGWPFEAWTCGEQVHGCEVHVVTAQDRGKGRTSRATSVGDADAMVTNEKDVLLTSFYADCVPLYFFDQARSVIALAHAGWKGTVLEIARLTVEAMQANYGCEAGQIQAAIGPSIGSCCYEVDEVVLGRVNPIIRELELVQSDQSGALSEIVKPTSGGKARINLKELNRQIMIKAGILPTHIEISEWCTGCSTELFFSHRVEGGPTGRMVSWIGMKKGETNA
ncbi:peptidoglycan editing factor PgeF [Paenibacillus solisilvae]|uniref:Purine nucleoside phosphorylase n=1 Tax=Paenibacillus solisilvae TaxID=2486751 RepID=A0ABW0W0K9_9BACL